MSYNSKNSVKSFIKNFDQQYFAGFIERLIRKIRGAKKPAPKIILTAEEKEIALKEVIRQIRLPIPTDHDLKRVEIIILNYRSPEMESLCAKHLIENTNWPYKLNFFDNRPGTKNMSKIINKLVRESTCEYIVIMDSDCFVPKLEPCWLTRCMEVFEQYPDCYVVSPTVSRLSVPQQQADGPRDGSPVKLTEAFSNPCSLHRKEVFEKVGYYDEDFLMFGSDVEWGYRVVTSPECSAYLRPDVFVEHIHHGSTKKAGREEQEFSKIKATEAEYSMNLFKQKTGRS